MAKKNDDMKIIVYILGTLIFSIFLLNSLRVYKKFASKYDIENADLRVNDSTMFIKYILLAIPCAVVLGFMWIALDYNIILSGNPIPEKLIFEITGRVIISIPLLIWLIVISARIGTTQIGVCIYKNKDRFVIPGDPHNNSLIENIKLKFVGDLTSMEELKISDIQKITRQSGIKLFVHGNFGTRCISWRDKQKRDECIAALEMSCGKRLSSVDMGM